LALTFGSKTNCENSSSSPAGAHPCATLLQTAVEKTTNLLEIPYADGICKQFLVVMLCSLVFCSFYLSPLFFFPCVSRQLDKNPCHQREDEVPPNPIRRVVLDTNVLVGAAYDAGSASRRIVDACLWGQLVAVASPALQKEYAQVLPRAVRTPEYLRALQRLEEMLLVVVPTDVPRVVPEDREDDKLVAVALAAGADALITNDRHLLALDPHGPLRILRPAAFAHRWLPGE
jgi:putative PIN family toxin of toxin-antitoxin system